jgi:hypothetical protein
LVSTTTPAVPAGDAATITAMADDFERRDEFGVSWFLIDDLSRLSRNTIARAYDFASPHE